MPTLSFSRAIQDCCSVTYKKILIFGTKSWGHGWDLIYKWLLHLQFQYRCFPPIWQIRDIWLSTSQAFQLFCSLGHEFIRSHFSLTLTLTVRQVLPCRLQSMKISQTWTLLNLTLTTRGIGFTVQNCVCFLKIITFHKLFQELLNQY